MIEVDVFIRVAIDEQQLIVLQIGDHALAVDLEIEHKQSYAEKDQRGEDDGLQDLANRTSCCFGRLLHFWCVRVLDGFCGVIVPNRPQGVGAGAIPLWYSPKIVPGPGGIRASPGLGRQFIH